MPENGDRFRRWLLTLLGALTLALPTAVPAGDCNGNGKGDASDIEDGRSADANGNLVPDECEGAPLPFGPPVELPLGSTPRVFVAADFTGDGRPDLACAFRQGSQTGPGVALFAGAADGGMALASDASGLSVSRLATGDLDGDGDLDLAAVDSEALWAILNDGKGGFLKKAKLLDADGIAGLAIGGIDEDSAVDIVVTRRPDDVAIVIRGGSGGAFSRPASFPSGSSPGTVVLLDFDGDHDLDAATSCQQPGGVQLLVNGGSGVFTLGARLSAGGVSAELLATADWNADGLPDLAAATRFVLQFLLNAGGGAFHDAVPFALGRDVQPIRGLTAGDADGDGDLDIAAGLASTPPGAIIVRNRGDGVFNGTARLVLDSAPFALSIVDLNGDGQSDLVFALQGRGGLWLCVSAEVREAEAGAEPSLDLVSETAHVGFEPHSCVLRDLDGDKDLDIGIIDGETNFKVLRNSGDGAFSLQRNYDVRDSLEMISVAAGDFDGDSDVDIGLADEYTNRVLVLSNQGKGTFRQTGSYAAGEHPSHLSAGDLTGDGNLDLLCVNSENNSLSIFEGTRAGGFAEGRMVQVSSRPQAATMGDFDGDGTLDIVVAGYGASQVLFLFGGGKGSYERRKSYPARWPTFVAAADLDGDSTLDLTAACYGARQVAIFLNKGKGVFAAARALDTGEPPFTLLHADLNGDGRLDIVTSNTSAESVSVLLNRGEGSFAEPITYPVGYDPRFAMAGDIDGDGDVDVVSANHSSLDLTVLRNQTRKASPKRPYLKKVSTEADFHAISMRAARSQGAPASSFLRETKFIVPADPRDSSLLPPVFQDVKKQPLHQLFLAEAFPEKFPALSAEAYDALTGRRVSRKYWSGIIRSVRTPKGALYGFNVLGAFSDDASELPRPTEVRAVYETLSNAFALRPLVYYPDAGLPREDAHRWREAAGFPVLVETSGRAPTYASYTRGESYGRVRVLTQAAFEELNAKGVLSYQDILVLERAPRDIEGVVAGIITAEPQGELSHLALRTARRGTPNAFLGGALNAFRGLDGKLIRLEVGEETYWSVEASASDAGAWWEAHRRKPPVLPGADIAYGALDSLTEMDLSSDASPEARYGGKASNLGRLSRIFNGPFATYREIGFAVPMRWYFEFIRSSRVPSARDPSREVSGAEFLAEIVEWPAFQSDSRLRFETLQRFRESLETAGEVDPDLVTRIARRVREIFGTAEKAVRFRSSSNVEDALEFNGAGLYESTSGCAADDLDGDDDGPCRCDPSKPAERGIARALKRVWSSLWNFRAYEERSYYGIPQESAAMGVLVSAAFADERANGVAMTGNPQSSFDSRFLVTAQVREESVVSPEPGVIPESDLLELSGGTVAAIARAQRSTLVAEGEDVLSDRELAELGAILSHIDQRFPVDVGGRRRDDVLLDVEFKVDSDGCLAVKQVRPFLRQDAAAPAPVLELEVPPGIEACGAFVPSRTPRRSYELKATVRFASGKFRLPTREEPSAIEGASALVEELRVGPDRKLAETSGPGRSEATRIPAEGDDSYRIRYTQPFTMPGGESLELEMMFDVPAGAASARAPGFVLDDEALTHGVTLQANMGLVVTFSSCSYALLPLWEVEAILEGGLTVKLLERHAPPPTLNDTGPAALVRAELIADGSRRVVDEYRDLVYTSLRHNRALRYWVVLEPPLELPGATRAANVLEVVAPEPRLGIEAEAKFLDERYEPIATRAVISFHRSEASVASFETFTSPSAPSEAGGPPTITECLELLDHVIYCEPPPRRVGAMDLDGSGTLTPVDAALLLMHLFESGGNPGVTPS